MADKTHSPQAAEMLKQYAAQVVAMTDLPIEWLAKNGVHLGFTHDVCRLPETPVTGLLPNIWNPLIRFWNTSCKRHSYSAMKIRISYGSSILSESCRENWGSKSGHAWTKLPFQTGANAVTTSYMPLQIMHATVLYIRLLHNLDEAAYKKIHVNWMAFISHLMRTSYIYAPLKYLHRKNIPAEKDDLERDEQHFLVIDDFRKQTEDL